MATEKEKIHIAPPAIDSTLGRTEEADREEWDETQELLNDPFFMRSHERAEKDRANGVSNGVSKKFSEIRRKV